MQAYQQRMIAEARAKEEMKSINEESILAARLQRIDELQMNPGEDKFARLSGSLQLAAFAGRLDSIKWFLRKHSPIDEYDSKGFSALHYAADKGFNEIVRYLLNQGADVDLPTVGGKVTPLMQAAKSGMSETLRVLWEGGASLIAKDISGQTAAHFAAQEDRGECIAMLHTLCLEQIERLQNEAAGEAEKMAAMGLVGTVNTTADKASIISAATEDDIKAAQTPPSVSLVIDSPSKNGTRPLHVAAAFASLGAMEVLVRLGAEVNAQDNMRETAMHRAARRNYFECYDFLKMAGGDDKIRNLMGETPSDVLFDR